jgi:hypothetical protein
MMKRSLLLTVLLIVSGLFLQALDANQALVLQITGKAMIQKSGTTRWETAKVKNVLNTGDFIMTGAGSVAKLSILDAGGIITLSENSKLLITDTPRAKGKAPGFLIFVGQMSSKIEKKGGTDIDFQTPTAVVGVRGTELQVAVADDGTSRVGVTRGIVGLNGMQNSVALASNESSTVALGGEPQDKTPFTDSASLDQWKKSVTASIKGRELEILTKVEAALNYNYKLIDLTAAQQDEMTKKIESLKAERKKFADKGDKAGVDTTSNGIIGLVGDFSRLNVKIYGLDWQNQSIIEIAQRLKDRNSGNKQIVKIYNGLNTTFEGYHSRFVKTSRK